MRHIRISPATVAAVFSLAVGLGVCVWGYHDLADSYMTRQETHQRTVSGATASDEEVVSNAEQEPELSEAGVNVPREGPSADHP
jgi:hypothetical protein